MNKIIVRPAAPTDFPQWLPLWDGYNAFYGRSGPTALKRDSVLLSGRKVAVPRVAVEAGVTDAWHKYVGLNGAVVGLDRRVYTLPKVCRLNSDAAWSALSNTKLVVW